MKTSVKALTLIVGMLLATSLFAEEIEKFLVKEKIPSFKKAIQFRQNMVKRFEKQAKTTQQKQLIAVARKDLILLVQALGAMEKGLKNSGNRDTINFTDTELQLLKQGLSAISERPRSYFLKAWRGQGKGKGKGNARRGKRGNRKNPFRKIRKKLRPIQMKARWLSLQADREEAKAKILKMRSEMLKLQAKVLRLNRQVGQAQRQYYRVAGIKNRPKAPAKKAERRVIPKGVKFFISGFKFKNEATSFGLTYFHKGPYKNLPQARAKMMAWIKGQKLKVSGAPVHIYLNNPNQTTVDQLMTKVFIPLAPLKQAVPGTEQYRFLTLRKIQVVSVYYSGPAQYSDLSHAHLVKYIKSKGYFISGPPRHRFFAGKVNGKLNVEVQFPVKLLK